MNGSPLPLDLRPLRAAVVGGEGHVGVGVVVQLGQPGVEVGQFVVGGGRVGRGRGVHERGDRSVGGGHPAQHAARRRSRGR